MATNDANAAEQLCALCGQPDSLCVCATGPRVVLTCFSCQESWEPDLTAPDGVAELGCPHCGGWTWMGELAEPTSATAEQHRRAV